MPQHISVNVTLVDRNFTHFHPGMPAEQTHLRQGPSRRIVADALALPFARSSFDVVSCALLVHHFQPEQLRAFTAEALRVARVAVLINDLRRNLISLALVYAGFPAFRSRLTRHDAPASVRRAYTMGELKAILKASGGGQVEIARHYLFRMGAIVWKQSDSFQFPVSSFQSQRHVHKSSGNRKRETENRESKDSCTT
jgi:ubiquinone/menaquinone biosynthesis C-methylase UbiE